MAKLCHSIFACATLSLFACTNNDIVVDVLNLPSQANRMEVRVQLNGRDAKLLSIEPARDRFILNLPEAMEGHVALQVAGIGSVGCWTSEGSTEFDFSIGKHSPTFVEVEQRESTLCPLDVRIMGEGRVHSASNEVDCSTERCRYMRPGSGPFTLTALPSLPGYQWIWAGDCTGSAMDCNLNFPSAPTVFVDFYPKPCIKGSTNGCWSEEFPKSPVPKNLDALWVSLNGVVFAAEDNTIWSTSAPYTSWSQVKLQSGTVIHAIGGSSAQAVWAVGDNGAIWTYSPAGASWVRSTGPGPQKLLGIWGAAPSGVWVVGENNTVLHWNGSVWSSEAPALAYPNQALRGIWGTDDENVWAVGQAGLVVNRTAGMWRTNVIDPSVELRAIWGRDATHIWAVGDQPGGSSGRGGSVYFFDGNKWSLKLLSSAQPLTSVWGSGVRDVWAVGIGGGILHYDGAGWKSAPVSFGPSGMLDLLGISGSACDNIWTISSGRVFHYAP